MSKVIIVTDSAANLSNAEDYAGDQLVIVPYQLVIDTRTYREGIDIDADDAITLINKAKSAPKLIAPTMEQYVRVFRKALEQTDKVLSIHTSRELTDSWANAKAAAQQIGHNGIVVLDSQAICAAQGMLVKVALEACAGSDDLEEIVRVVRGAIERIYVVYYVETLDALQRSGVLSAAHSALGTMLGMKPFLTFEEGRLVAHEKVKTRAQAIDRLVEFIVEFTEVKEGVIVQPRDESTEQTRMLHERLQEDFPEHVFPTVVYNPSLAILIGTDATGICIIEDEWEQIEDYFDDED